MDNERKRQVEKTARQRATTKAGTSEVDGEQSLEEQRERERPAQ